MSAVSRPAAVFIGWDVGGWHCDRNRDSRDAVVILDADRAIVGTPWRGNLRASIDAATTTESWVRALFDLCRADAPAAASVTLAIDTPLGFSDAFVRLVTRGSPVECVGEDSGRNPYLFRTTEQFLFEHDIKPLSPVKDMIGSQATKGMHVLAKFAPHVVSCGVWSDGNRLTAIEAYPTPCRRSARIAALLPPEAATLDHSDKSDALLCALVANLFATERDSLAAPAADVPVSEGWIWVPQDALPVPTWERRT
jgi:hypothetical protein